MTDPNRNLGTEPETERSPNSDTPQALEFGVQKQEMSDRIDDIKAKMERGEVLTDTEKALFDQIAGDLVNRMKSLADEARNQPGNLSIYLRMVDMAKATNLYASDSIVPESAPAAESIIVIPPHSNPTGITGREETVMMQATVAAPTSGIETPTLVPVPQSPVETPKRVVQSGVAAIMEPAVSVVSLPGQASPVAPSLVSTTPLFTPAPAFVPEDQRVTIPETRREIPQPAPVTLPMFGTAPNPTPEAVAAPISSNPPSSPRRSFPDAQLISNDLPQPLLHEGADHSHGETDPEMLAFMNSTTDPKIIASVDEKRRLKAILDEMALEYVNNRHISEYNRTKRSGSTIKKVGQAALSGVSAVLLAPFRLVDKAIGGPELTMYKNMKYQKENDLSQQRKDLERDLATINTGIDAMSEYLDRSYGKTFRLGAMTQPEINTFFEDCLSNTYSPHNANIRRIIEEQTQERVALYNEQIDKIQKDTSYDENFKALLYGTPKSEKPELDLDGQEIDDSTRGSAYLRTRHWVSSLFNKAPETERLSWFDKKIGLPVLGMVVAYGLTQKASLYNEASIPSQVEDTTITDLNKLKAEKKEKRNKKIGWVAAAAAALGIATLGGYGVYKEVKKHTTETADNGDKPVEKGGATAPTSSPTTTPAPANTVVAVNNDPQPVATVPAPKLDSTKGQTDAPAKPKTAHVTHTGPAKAKISVINKGTDQPIEVEKPKEVKKEVTETTPLTNMEIDKIARDADSRISAYKRKVTLILGSDFEPSKDQEEYLFALIDQVTGTLRVLKTHKEAQVLENTFSRIDGVFTQLEKQRTAKFAPKYTAEAEFQSKYGLKQISDLKALTGGKNRFTIHHPVSTSKIASTTKKPGTMEYTQAMVPYSVDLDAIAMKLTKIASENSLHKDLARSETQARLDAADAKYWADYLRFVDWYVRYKFNDKESVTF